MMFFHVKRKLKNLFRSKFTDRQLDLFLFVVTDILTNDSVGLALGKMTHAVETAFNSKLDNNTVLLKGVVSRKKQIVPVLTDTLKSL